MKAQEYIQLQLNELLTPIDLDRSGDNENLIKNITKLTLSKKFRKYSVNPEVLDHIKNSIKNNVEKNEPIKFTLPFGAYKLWRLDETPEADWAELFSLMYFTKWVKPLCAIYAPGVWFDFFSDEIIVPRMNNIPSTDLGSYERTFREVLEFLKPYQPKNLNMTLSRVRDQYANDEEFEQDLKEQMVKLEESLDNELPKVDEVDEALVELNVKTTPEQEADPNWREKVLFIHNSYAQVKGRRPYYRPPEMNKIMVVCTPLWGMLCVGSTKSSVAKFWAGTGALRPKENSYKEVILSPSQIEKAQFNFEPISIKGLESKNFKKIRILS